MMYKIQDSLRETENKERRFGKIFTVVICIVLLALIAVIVLNNTIFMTVKVSGPSMEDTLKDGDYLIVNTVKEAKDKDIIIIKDAKANSWIIKRVIAVGGEHVRIADDGVVWLKKAGQLSEEPLNEPYAKGKTYTDVKAFKNGIDVPEGCYFYLGDNRENSSDSRYYGFCKKDQIVGVVEEWSISTKGFRNFVFGIINSFSNCAGRDVG